MDAMGIAFGIGTDGTRSDGISADGFRRGYPTYRLPVCRLGFVVRRRMEPGFDHATGAGAKPSGSAPSRAGSRLGSPPIACWSTLTHGVHTIWDLAWELCASVTAIRSLQ